jgi:hypothetical protein
MSIEMLIERWFAVGSLFFGLSHLVSPERWAALFLPLRDNPVGGLLLALFNLPIALLIVLGHNVWVWDARTIVTLAGWIMMGKSLVYLFVPGSLGRVMPQRERFVRAIRVAGVLMTIVGAVLVYDVFLASHWSVAGR